jgi:hypothetical protein
MEDLHVNIQNSITPLIFNENARSKVQNALHPKLYKNHLKISRIGTIEIYLDDDAAAGFVLLNAWKMKTDAQ